MQLKIVTLSILFIHLFGISVSAQEILQWRGIDRTGHYASENLLAKWPEQGPELLMHIDELPESYSSVIMKNNILYTTGINDTSEILTAINFRGKLLWNTVYGKSWEGSFSNARCTPTIEGNYAYLVSGSGYLACVEISSGKLIWSFDAFTKFGGKCGSWGTAESPLIVDDKVIYTPCGDKTTMIAVDKTTGETTWMSECIQDNSAYCSPIVVERNEIKLIITVTGNYVLGVNAENGEIAWKFEYTSIDEPFSGGDINPVTPLVKGNEIFITSGYNHVGIMLSMADDLKSVRLKWITEDLDVHHGGVAEYDGFIYGANYTSIRNGKWVCIDWETGMLHYERDWYGKGSIIFSDGKLICYDERQGNVALVNASSEKFDILSEFKIEFGRGPHWSHPTIYDDKLLIRHGADLMIYNIGENK